eukprot:scaffold23067_cov46-Cyclotella_meneghiniana.AAC.1
MVECNNNGERALISRFVLKFAFWGQFAFWAPLACIDNSNLFSLQHPPLKHSTTQDENSTVWCNF